MGNSYNSKEECSESIEDNTTENPSNSCYGVEIYDMKHTD